MSEKSPTGKKFRVVKRWHEKALRFVFVIQKWEDEVDDVDEYCSSGWYDLGPPFDTEDDAKAKVAQTILMNLGRFDSEVVIAEY